MELEDKTTAVQKKLTSTYTGVIRKFMGNMSDAKAVQISHSEGTTEMQRASVSYAFLLRLIH